MGFDTSVTHNASIEETSLFLVYRSASELLFQAESSHIMAAFANSVLLLMLLCAQVNFVGLLKGEKET